MKKTLPLLLAMILALGADAAWAQGKFSGIVFGDYFYNAARDTNFYKGNLPNAANGGPESNQGFLIRRINFSYDYDIAEDFATRFRLEADASGGPNGDVDVAHKLTVYIKDAWLRWKKAFGSNDLIFGVQPTPAFDISESAWSYRNVEKTIMDLRGIVSSRGLGFGMRGNFDQSGSVNYWLLISNQGNGSVPKDLSSALSNGDKYNQYGLLIQVKPTKEFFVTVYGDYRPTYPVNDPTSTAVPKATVSHGTITGAAFLNYTQADKFSVGLEGFMQSTAHSYALPSDPTALKSLTRMGVSIWAWANFDPMVSGLLRFDTFNPVTGSDNLEKGDSRNYIIAGVAFKPIKQFQLIPNVVVETYESVPDGGPSYDASVTGRLTFSYSF